MRACNTCHQIKPLDEFHRSPTGKDGRMNKCAACCTEYHRAYVARRRAEAREAGTAVEPPKLRGARLSGSARSFEAFERNNRCQDLAILGASMARLRKALNAWWEASKGGEEVECGTSLLAARVALRAAAEEDGKALRRRRA